MSIVEHKQHVPIFVGSTFEDLKEYRRAVRDSLSQLETIVKGMEYFGSKPGTPMDECLIEVKSCQVYIGVFGMRYGSVPEGQELSMTHLEYEEAQRCGLPSLIYVIDENNQPILPKYVETGSGALALVSLKDQLKKRHVVSMFTTPSDLAAKILYDVPEVLKDIGATILGDFPYAGVDSVEVLEKFKLLPKMMRGREVTIEFSIDQLWQVESNECEALNLEAGATIRTYVKLSTGSWIYVYALNQIAESLSSLEKGSKVRVQATLVYGVTKEIDWGDDGPVTKNNDHSGACIEKIVEVMAPSIESSS